MTACSMTGQDAAGLAFRQVLLGTRIQFPGRKGLELSGTKELKEERGVAAVPAASVQSQMDWGKEQSLSQGRDANSAVSPPDKQLLVLLKLCPL